MVALRSLQIERTMAATGVEAPWGPIVARMTTPEEREASGVGALDEAPLLEKIETNIERWPVLGLYPRLTLGPGQRFASKTGYVVRCVPRTRSRGYGARVRSDR